MWEAVGCTCSGEGRLHSGAGPRLQFAYCKPHGQAATEPFRGLGVLVWYDLQCRTQGSAQKPHGYADSDLAVYAAVVEQLWS